MRPKNCLTISLHIERDSPLHKHLVEEARANGYGTSKPKLAPYIQELLRDRDRGIYGETVGRPLWFLSAPKYLIEIIGKLLDQKIPPLLANLAIVGGSSTPPPEPVEIIEEDTEEEMDESAEGMLGALLGFGR